MQVIVYMDKSGAFVTCVPTGELPIEEVFIKDVPQGCGAKIFEMEDLPLSDRDFYPAWELVDGEVIVNIDKAKDVTKDRLRIERQPLLEKLDIQFQRAMENNEDTTIIVAEKNRLRDITNLVDAIENLDQLRALSC